MNRAAALKAEARAAVGRVIAGRRSQVLVEHVREALPTDLSRELSDKDIAAALRASGWERWGNGNYRPADKGEAA